MIEILITPVMIQDHMPNQIMIGLQKLFVNASEQKVQKCKTISNGRYSRDDLAARPLLSYQYSSNWSNDTLDRTSTIQIQPTRQNQYEYPEMEIRSSSKNSSLNEKANSVYSYRLKKKRSINDIIRKIKSDSTKKIDPTNLYETIEELYGKAPLATPETLSETSSICSRSATTNDLISNRNNNLKTVKEGVLNENLTSTNDANAVTIQIENDKQPENLDKVDVTLNIDVNAIFDQMEKTNQTTSSNNNQDRLEDQLNVRQLNRKFVKRTSSLKRTDSATSSSSKRVTFDSSTVLNTGKTVLINKPFCKRSNSERIRRNVFSPSSLNTKNQKLKQVRKEHENQIVVNVKNRDQVDNELNEKLEELLGHSLSYSDTNLNKLEDNENDKFNLACKLEGESNSETIEVYVHNPNELKTTSNEQQQFSKLASEYSPVKQIISPITDDYSIKIGSNANNQIVVSNMSLSRSNESSPRKSASTSSTYKSFQDDELVVDDLYDKEQYEKLFQKLSTIESPIDEELACDKNFKSDLNKINE